MNASIPIYIYFTTLSLILFNVSAVVFKKQGILKILGIPTLIFSLLGVYLIWHYSGHLPMSGTFEKMQSIAMLIICIGLMFVYLNKTNSIKSYDFWFIALFFQLMVLFDEFKAGDFYYIYDNIYVVCFFQFKIISIAIIGVALSQYISAFRFKSDPSISNALINSGINLTILGAVFFLSSEFAGSVWSQIGYGDTWRWSKNFFMSGGIFLLTLIGNHVCYSWLKNRKQQIVISMIPLILIIVLFSI